MGTDVTAYLNKANVYGGSNTHEGRNLPSLPVPGFPLPRPPAFLAASAQAQGAGRGSFHGSTIPRALVVTVRKCLYEFFSS